MKDVDLVAGEEIECAQHDGFRVEVTRDIEHETAIAEPRSVHDPDRRQHKPRPGSRRGEQAAQRLEPVEDAGGRRAHDADALDGIHDERVRLGGGLPFDGSDLEP